MSITDWPVDERPRERLLQHGPKSLSDSELLAIFIRTGVKGQSAIDLARNLLNYSGGLRQLFELDQEEFCQQAGFGIAKFVQFQAVLELSRRYYFDSMRKNVTLDNASAVKQFLLATLSHKHYEVFCCLLLDTKYQAIKFIELFRGGVNGAVIYPGEVVKAALSHHATSVIFAHNHPSGSLKPSKEDLSVTCQLQKALALVDIEVVDHFVVGKNEAISCLVGGGCAGS